MSRYFVLPEDGIGPGGYIVFRKRQDGMYTLYVGDKFFGTVHNLKWHWAAVSWNEQPSEFFNVNDLDGFATRLHAAQFIIKHHGYWMRDERERKKVEEDLRVSIFRVSISRRKQTS